MKCSLVIPVRNDPARLGRLLEQASQLDCFARAIVVDDASDADLRPDSLLPAKSDWVRLIRQDKRRGAGAARNRGLKYVETSHLLFFDSDDLLTPELPLLLADLDGRNFDFCIFKHNNSHMSDAGFWGQTQWDEALWHRAGAAVGALKEVSHAAAPILARTANFPWNKIYRTGFLRDNDIRCSETLVHNDIALHWMSFLLARDVLSSDRIAAIHYVGHEAGRLTNFSGPERLDVFAVLGDLYKKIGTDPHFSSAFLRFTSHLFDWIRGTIEPAQHSALDARIRDFLLSTISPADFRALSYSDPALALRINLQLIATRERTEAQTT